MSTLKTNKIENVAGSKSALVEDLANLVSGGLPTSDPLVVGKLWNNNGVVTISAG